MVFPFFAAATLSGLTHGVERPLRAIRPVQIRFFTATHENCRILAVDGWLKPKKAMVPMFNNDNPIYEFRGPFGVPVQIGGSFILLFFVFVSFNHGPREMMYDLAFLGLLVGSIFLHELGHAWGCLIQNVPVRRIMIYGGGGFCERTRSATRYEQELIVAMGPIVNLVIWAVASLSLPFLTANGSYGNLAWTLETLAYINIFLAIFNLLPVHPLDGGKLFQLLLMRFLKPSSATRISGGVGLLFSVLWIPMMVFTYTQFGLVLFFIPPFGLHLQMLRRMA